MTHPRSFGFPQLTLVKTVIPTLREESEWSPWVNVGLREPFILPRKDSSVTPRNDNDKKGLRAASSLCLKRDYTLAQYYVYIMTNERWTLYTGMTNDLERRVYQHKTKQAPGFNTKYNITKLVYFESTDEVQVAIAREKEIKGWRRSKKTDLINSSNPAWNDLAADWYDI